MYDNQGKHGMDRLADGYLYHMILAPEFSANGNGYISCKFIVTKSKIHLYPNYCQTRTNAIGH